MSSYRHTRSMDPQELASRFGEEAVLEVPDEAYALEWKQEHLQKVLEMLGGLPPMEADIIRLYFFFGKRQTDIAEIFGFTQAAISYRLKRAILRLRFLLDMPDLDVNVMKRDLTQVLSPQDADIFVQMAMSTCQSEVAALLSLSQGMVRHRFLKRLRVLSVSALDRIYPWAFTSAHKDPDHALKEPLRQLWNQAYDNRNGAEAEVSGEMMRVFSCFLDMARFIQESADSAEDDSNFKLGLLPKAKPSSGIAHPEVAVRWADYCRLFYLIRANYNILHEVKLPQWSDRPELVLF
jgi:hypothetical protein